MAPGLRPSEVEMWAGEPGSRTEILVVDDEEPIRDILRRMLMSGGYRCAEARNAQEARDFLEEQAFDLVLCDMKMPGESGLDLIRHVSRRYPDTATIMVTAIDDREVANAALETGAYGYVLKPFQRTEILIQVANAMRRRQLEIESRVHMEGLETEVFRRTEQLRDREARLQHTLEKLRTAMEGIIRAMARALETRDPYTAGHQVRVAGLASAIAGKLDLPADQREGVHMAAMIHDIGKIAVPAEILNKPGTLSDIEFALIKTHPQVGYEILKAIEFPWPIAETVLQHHERIDGSGYPQGLSGDAILLEARILAVADVVEAMASHRPYRPAVGIEAAMQEISQKKGLLYNTRVVESLEELYTEKGFEPFCGNAV
jgi:putative two-component system response regulator